VFVSGKGYTEEQLREMRIEQVRRQLAQIQGAGEGGEGEEEGSEESEYEYDEEEDDSSSEEEDKKEQKEKHIETSNIKYLRNIESPSKKLKDVVTSQSDTLGKKRMDMEEQKSPLKKHVLLDKQTS